MMDSFDHDSINIGAYRRIKQKKLSQENIRKSVVPKPSTKEKMTHGQFLSGIKLV